jgi:hypothetical protein
VRRSRQGWASSYLDSNRNGRIDDEAVIEIERAPHAS